MPSGSKTQSSELPRQQQNIQGLHHSRTKTDVACIDSSGVHFSSEEEGKRVTETELSKVGVPPPNRKRSKRRRGYKLCRYPDICINCLCSNWKHFQEYFTQFWKINNSNPTCVFEGRNVSVAAIPKFGKWSSCILVILIEYQEKHVCRRGRAACVRYCMLDPDWRPRNEHKLQINCSCWEGGHISCSLTENIFLSPLRQGSLIEITSVWWRIIG